MRPPRVVVYDYGSGNVRSAQRAIERAGADVEVTDDQVAAVRCDGLVVPGVGAFGACVEGIEQVGGRAVLGDRIDRERPVLGVCVGMQVLFDASDESPDAKGLGALPGTVRKLTADVLPHTGWNTVEAREDSVLLSGLGGERFYFTHSYAPLAGAPDYVDVTEVSGWSEHGVRFASVIERGALAATQFHPEKSGEAGIRLLRNWLGSL